MSSVHSLRENVLLGFLYLILYSEVYNTQSDAVFVPPLKPGQTSTTPMGSTGHQITGQGRQHKSDRDEFQKYYQTDKALKYILVGAVDKAYIRPLRISKLAMKT